jgi:acyl-CoA thioesterase YciA
MDTQQQNTPPKDIPSKPSGELVIRTIAMPKDTNFNGDIFGGWVLSQMDIGGSTISKQKSPTGRTVTIAIQGMKFINPIKIGTQVSCYGYIIKEGHTSVTVSLEVWTYNFVTHETKIVTQGIFTYVAIDEHGKPIPILKN